TQKLETVVAPQSAKPKVLSIPFATVVCCNLLNPSQINTRPFGGFTPRTMSFYKYGRKNFFLPVTEWLSVLSARDDCRPSPETGISFQGELDGERRPARTSSEGAAAQRCGALLLKATPPD